MVFAETQPRFGYLNLPATCNREERESIESSVHDLGIVFCMHGGTRVYKEPRIELVLPTGSTHVILRSFSCGSDFTRDIAHGYHTVQMDYLTTSFLETKL